jgi:hypothetical protein
VADSYCFHLPARQERATLEFVSGIRKEGADELDGRRMERHLEQMRSDVLDAADRMADQHPLDTLLEMMCEHGWGDDDPMMRLVKEATRVPYPMPRWEAVARGLLENR